MWLCQCSLACAGKLCQNDDSGQIDVFCVLYTDPILLIIMITWTRLLCEIASHNACRNPKHMPVKTNFD